MTESYQFDVLYLGAGHGAFDGAVPLANSGKKVAIIEADKIGELVQTVDATRKLRWTTRFNFYATKNALMAL
ncbi:Glutathione-disulfide reductase [Pediococcus acidilactici]|nr:Glutathione-disulfide reductase [Pediococcus acidilactici]